MCCLLFPFTKTSQRKQKTCHFANCRRGLVILSRQQKRYMITTWVCTITFLQCFKLLFTGLECRFVMGIVDS